MVNISVRVLSKPDTAHLPEIYRRLGTDYDDRVLPSIVNEVCKQVIAQFNAAQLLTQREQVSRLIRRNLVARAEEFHILLDDVSITDLRFGREFTAAVERKQVAQQVCVFCFVFLCELGKLILLSARQKNSRTRNELGSWSTR